MKSAGREVSAAHKGTVCLTGAPGSASACACARLRPRVRLRGVAVERAVEARGRQTLSDSDWSVAGWPEAWRRAFTMPGMVLFGRRWAIASDDLVFPGSFELFLRVLW